MIKNTLAGSMFDIFLPPNIITEQQQNEIRIITNQIIESALKKDLDNINQFNQFQKEIAVSVAQIIEISKRENNNG